MEFAEHPLGERDKHPTGGTVGELREHERERLTWGGDEIDNPKTVSSYKESGAKII